MLFVWVVGFDYIVMFDFVVLYIKVFKVGEIVFVIDSEMLVYWYCFYFKLVFCDSIDICGFRFIGWDFLEDIVFVFIMIKFGGIVKVMLGGN